MAVQSRRKMTPLRALAPDSNHFLATKAAVLVKGWRVSRPDAPVQT